TPEMTPTVTSAPPVPEPKPVKIGGLRSIRSVRQEEEAAALIHTPKADLPPEQVKVDFTEGHAIGVLSDFFKTRSSPNEKLLFESGYDIDGTHIRFKLPNTFLLSLFE